MRHRQEHEELILRFFAFSEQYPYFSDISRGVSDALDNYMRERNETLKEEHRAALVAGFQRMLKFVSASFKYGFTAGRGKHVSRPIFEAISVGVHLALNEKPDLPPRDIDIEKWMRDDAFRLVVSGERQTHSAKKIVARIDYVRNKRLHG